MTAEFSRARRFALAGVALALSALLFRSQIADALVIRGDDYLYRGDSVAALERYRRALSIEPRSQTAADRYVFVSMRVQTRASLDRAIAAATRYLSRRPSDATVLGDRALCYLHEKRYALAQADFERAARSARSPSAYVFAGWAAKRGGRDAAARALWIRALRVSPRYRPARVALTQDRR